MEIEARGVRVRINLSQMIGVQRRRAAAEGRDPAAAPGRVYPPAGETVKAVEEKKGWSVKHAHDAYSPCRMCWTLVGGQQVDA
jgi:hypothetical protein